MKPIRSLTEDEFAQLARRAAALPDAPPALLRAAIAIGRESLSEQLVSAAKSVLKRVTASLSFDSWAPSPLPAGVRSVPSSDVRHLLFSAQGRDIDLRITRAAGHFAVAGQILGPDESGMVELIAQSAGSAPLRVAALDALGEFRLDGVARGTYVMKLALGNDEIVLSPIDVGDRPD
jgi:hypothetical protein